MLKTSYYSLLNRNSFCTFALPKSKLKRKLHHVVKYKFEEGYLQKAR